MARTRSRSSAGDSPTEAGKSRVAQPVPGQRRRPQASPSAFLGSLGLVGLARLEPILLAALATEAPVLLVGAHGTAKSLLVERLARALELPFRHYNASLVNYDDLVGIPLPDESGTGLRFVGTQGATWGAGFAFLDEISRCRPELQNKLFPLIHERRVAGIELPELRHRWAAMNPPAPADALSSSLDTVYLGSEALDPALADRFAFVVRMPGWAELSQGDRLALVSGVRTPKDAAPGLDLRGLVARCAELVAETESLERERIGEYVIRVVDQLSAGRIALSPRRARTLARCVASVHAARIALAGSADLEESALIAVSSALPQTANEVPPSLATVAAAHHQAWEVAKLADDDPMREVLSELDPGRRIAAGARLGLVDEQLARVVTNATSSEPSDARRIGLGTAAFLALRDRRDLAPAAWSVLAGLARRVLAPCARTELLSLSGGSVEGWRVIQNRLARTDESAVLTPLERSFALSGFPDLWRQESFDAALARFRNDLALLGVSRKAKPCAS